MLIIDENMYRLAKMQETLLKVSNTNKEEILKKYKEIVVQIDTKAYSDILEEIKHINQYNQSLEQELEFLEKIKIAYHQLLELQLSFKQNCQTYDDNELKLSDLSRLNIEYIESRINAISGYLINLKNIEANKTKIQQLNEQLISEEKKKQLVDSRLANLEESLIYNFLHAEGRCISNENPKNLNSQPINIISEYRKLNIDFEDLLHNTNQLELLLKKVEKEKIGIEETLKATQFCYNQTPNQVNRQILDSTNLEATKIKYRLIMIKILDLVAQKTQSYQEVKKKRENLIQLINARIQCLKNLGEHILIDPFTRTKLKEQLDSLLSMSDNTTIISGIRKEIADLTSRTEEMTSENNNYLISLGNTKSLIEDTIGFGEIDVTHIELPIELEEPKEIQSNQIVNIRDISDSLNMHIVSQKTQSVIKRVNQMINSQEVNKKETIETYIPDLVIIPNQQPVVDSTFEETFEETFESITPSPETTQYDSLQAPKLNNEIFSFDSELIDITSESGNNILFDNAEEETFEEDENIDDEIEIIPQAAETNVDLFETITPFAAPTMFNDRQDEVVLEPSPEIIEFPTPEVVIQPEIIETPKIDSTISESFWPTQESFDMTQENEDDEPTLSFDEQINMLISSENNGKVLKKVA